jgi:hypothetical protein
MNWKIFFLKFFRNILFGVFLGALALGIFGYLVGGQAGLVNGAYWGAILGLIGGFFSGTTLFFKFLGQPGNYQYFPEYNWFIKRDEEKKEL